MIGEDGGSARLALGLVLAISVTVAGGMVLAGWADDGSGAEHTVGAAAPAGQSAATTSPPPAGAAPAGPEASTTTTAPPPGGPTTTTTAATRPSPPTTRAAPPETTTTTTTVTAGPDTYADGPPGPACDATMFEARLVLDATSHRPGQTVRGTATFTNVSGATCYWASSTGSVDIHDAAGRSVTYPAAVIRDGFRWIPFAAGEEFTLTPTWDQQACPPGPLPMPCSQAPPGAYTMVVTEQPYGAARAPFTLVAG